MRLEKVGSDSGLFSVGANRGFLLFHVLFIYVVRLFYQNKKYMKRVVLFAMVLMLGVISVQAQWSVVPEAGMTVMKAGQWLIGNRVGRLG